MAQIDDDFEDALGMTEKEVCSGGSGKPKLTYQALADRLRDCPPVRSVWQHYRTKGDYVVVGHAIAEATQEPSVIYEPFAYPIRFVRPAREWEELVEPDGGGEKVPRFRRVGA